MPKRVGHIYEKMADWDEIKAAEQTTTRRKAEKYYVRQHIRNRIRNMVEIQQSIVNGTMRTGDYAHEQKISGQNKLRDISKLDFHPNHIQHQLLCRAIRPRLEKYLIPTTYASRIGYGQIKCAKRIKKNFRKYIGKQRWVGQGDIVKYYDSTRHSLIESSLRRICKDERFIRAFMEPFQKFSSAGVGIPLGVPPSQTAGNLDLAPFDRFMTQELHAKDYVRYLDDFVFSAATKGEAKRIMKRAAAFLLRIGFQMHTPTVCLLTEGVDIMGFVYYGRKTDMWWRKADKVRWLSHRAKTINPKRIRELDAAAWGMLKHGNRSCKRLFREHSDNLFKSMGVQLGKAAITRVPRLDKNGIRYIDRKKIDMQPLFGNVVVIKEWLKNITTSKGPGRYALIIAWAGREWKLIVNSIEIKSFLDDMDASGVTELSTVFVDRGNYHYGIDESQTEILKVNNRPVEQLEDGTVVYSDTKEEVIFKQYKES